MIPNRLSFSYKTNCGYNFLLFHNAESKEKVDKNFIKLSADGKMIILMENTFSNALLRNFIYKFQTNYMMSLDRLEEIQIKIK